MKIPVKRKDIEIFSVDETTLPQLLMFSEMVQAGFPSPAQGVVPDTIDLGSELIHDPSSTFCARVVGESMIGEGIEQGDLLIIDRTLPPIDGCIAICSIDGDFTVKRLKITGDGVSLMPANPRFSPIKISTMNDFQVWGVVTHVIHKT